MRSVSSGFGYFWLSRLHTIAGIVFALAFILCFLVPYSYVFKGHEAFTAHMAELMRTPMLGWVLVLLVLIPLIYHASFGLLKVHGCQINAFHYGYYRNWMYALERIAGLILIPFVIYHIYKTWLAPAIGAGPLGYNAMRSLLTPTSIKSFYLVGIVCAAFYIGNGLAMQASGFGFAATRRSRSAAIIVGWIVTILLAVWGIAIVLSF